MPKIDETKLNAWRSFLIAHTEIVDRLDRQLESEIGLSLNWYEVLLHLAHVDDDRLRMHELAESLLLSRSAATRFVDRMERAGLVSRTTCEDDRRGTWVGLTDAGRELFAAAAPIHLGGIDDHFARHVTDDEAEILEQVLVRLVEAQRQP